MVRHPHTMIITTAADSVQDDGGNWVPGGTTTRQVQCRAVPNGGNEFITGEDGNRVDFGWLVYMPAQAVAIPIGAQVEIQTGVVTIKEAVKRFFTSQLNSKMWL